jgi:hypothetical protein
MKMDINVQHPSDGVELRANQSGRLVAYGTARRAGDGAGCATLVAGYLQRLKRGAKNKGGGETDRILRGTLHLVSPDYWYLIFNGLEPNSDYKLCVIEDPDGERPVKPVAFSVKKAPRRGANGNLDPDVEVVRIDWPDPTVPVPAVYDATGNSNQADVVGVMKTNNGAPGCRLFQGITTVHPGASGGFWAIHFTGLDPNPMANPYRLEVTDTSGFMSSKNNIQVR